jgi:hypothetical protein
MRNRRPTTHYRQSCSLAVASLRLAPLAEHIRAHRKLTFDSIADIGRTLTAAKGQLRHGQWLIWIATEVRMSEQTCLHYMRVADFAAKSKTIGDLRGIDPSALYLLTAPSTPKAAQELAIKDAQDGLHIGLTEMRRIIAETKEQAKQRRIAAKGNVPSSSPPVRKMDELPEQPTDLTPTERAEAKLRRYLEQIGAVEDRVTALAHCEKPAMPNDQLRETIRRFDGIMNTLGRLGDELKDRLAEQEHKEDGGAQSAQRTHSLQR